MSDLSKRNTKYYFFLIGIVGVVCLQFSMAHLGTELGWADGKEVGIQTLRTGKIIGIILGTLFALFALTVGLKWFRSRPVAASITIGLLGGIISAATVLLTMLRASASFLMNLAP